MGTSVEYSMEIVLDRLTFVGEGFIFLQVKRASYEFEMVVFACYLLGYRFGLFKMLMDFFLRDILSNAHLSDCIRVHSHAVIRCYPVVFDFPFGNALLIELKHSCQPRLVRIDSRLSRTHLEGKSQHHAVNGTHIQSGKGILQTFREEFYVHRIERTEKFCFINMIILFEFLQQ